MGKKRAPVTSETLEPGDGTLAAGPDEPLSGDGTLDAGQDGPVPGDGIQPAGLDDPAPGADDLPSGLEDLVPGADPLSPAPSVPSLEELGFDCESLKPPW